MIIRGIEWKGDFDKLITAEYGDYTMKVEDVGRNVYWEVRYLGDVIETADTPQISHRVGGYSPNMRGGTLKSINAMKRHQKTRRVL